MKVRGCQKGIAGCSAGAHDSKESAAANRGGKRVPKWKGTTARCRAVHTARKSHHPHKGAERGSPKWKGTAHDGPEK